MLLFYPSLNFPLLYVHLSPRILCKLLHIWNVFILGLSVVCCVCLCVCVCVCAFGGKCWKVFLAQLFALSSFLFLPALEMFLTSLSNSIGVRAI